MNPNERINSITKFVPADGVVLKDDSDSTGEIRAVFSVFNVKDRHGDIVRKEAFRDGEEIPLVWSHDWSEIIGKGVIRVTDNEAIFEGKFFIDQEDGSKRYKTVKSMGSLMQWSWGFSIKDDGYKILYDEDGMFDGFDIFKTERFEVSPVLVGANQYTRTLDVKSADGTARALNDNKSVGMWMKSLEKSSPSLNITVPNDVSGGLAERVTAAMKSEDQRSTEKFHDDLNHLFPHHDDEDGEPDIDKCMKIINGLNGDPRADTYAHPFLSLTDDERKALYDDVAEHVRASGATPPELRSAYEVIAEKNHHISFLAQLAQKAGLGVNFAYTDDVSYSDDDVHKIKDALSHVGVTFTDTHGGKTFAVEADELHASLQSFTARVADLVQLRAEQGRRFKWVEEESAELREAVEALLVLLNRDSGEPEETAEDVEPAAEAETDAEEKADAEETEHAEAAPKGMTAARAAREIKLRKAAAMRLAAEMMELDESQDE